MTTKLCSLVFLIEGDNILLAMKKRGFGANLWNGVGGKVEQGETLERGMIRETEEEISVTPKEYEEAGVLEFKNQKGESETTVHVFMCTAWDGEPIESEEMAPHWFKIAEIPYDRMWEGDKFWLPQVLDGKFIRGTFTFDADESLLAHEIHEA